MKGNSIMRIFDTLNNTKTELKFSDKVTIYLCGVTVYDDAHIGHARTICLLYTSPSPRDATLSRMPSSA